MSTSSLFPELETSVEVAAGVDDIEPEWSAETRALFDRLASAGDSELIAASESVYEQHRVRLSGPGIAASVAVTRRFEQALELPGMLRSLKRVDEGRIEFVAEIEGKLYSAGLGPVDEPAWRKGKTFALTYRDELHPRIARGLMRFLARYDGVPFATILALVEPDLADRHMLATDYLESVLYSYAPSNGWRRFFEGTELYRGTCGGHVGKVAIVDHTELECAFNHVPYEERLPGFFNVPPTEDERERDPSEPATQQIKLLTDIQDRDVIVGADVLLDRALESLADHPARPELVIVQAGCLPEVTGDDLQASVARTSARLRLPVVVVGQHNDPVGRSIGELVERETVELGRTLDPTLVMFVGLPAFRGRRQVFELFERAGIRVAGALLPNFDPDVVARLPAVSLFVLHPWERYEVSAKRMAARYAPARAIAPGTPFGVRGTRRWMLAIAEALGRRAEMLAVLDAAWAELAPRWAALRARARRHRLGFVVEQSSWQLALSARRSFGAPVVEQLGEMGFGLEVLAFAGTAALPEQRFDSLRVRSYADCDELARLLAADEVSAWYSELHYDRRLTRSGKNSFSLRHVRMGLQGAVDSLAELLDTIELPFYRRYGAYLGTAFPELGDPEHAGAR
ncbi:nitrogenase component 1 [Nannocystaceae bacterium ST9]